MQQSHLATVIGKARKTVNEALMLNTLPEPIKEEWRTSATLVSKSVLLQIARLDSLEEQTNFWQIAKDGGLTVRAARTQRKSGEDTAPKESPSAFRLALSSGKILAKKLQAVSAQALSDDDVHALFELHKEITYLIAEIDQRHKGNLGS